MITADGIGFSYGSGAVLAGVSLTAADGRVLGVVGPNGSGKTTLLRTLYGAVTPSTGVVAINGTAVQSMSPRDVSCRVAVVIQEPVTDLPLSVADVVLLGRSARLGMFERYLAHDRRAAATALRRVGLRQLASRAFTALSGGERQRALIARALAQEADHLLLDEPTNHLDVRYQHDVLQLVRSLGLTTVVVLHDLNLAARYCDDVLLLDHGRTVAFGSPGRVLIPDLLEPVYGIRVERIDDRGSPHLRFHPAA